MGDRVAVALFAAARADEFLAGPELTSVFCPLRGSKRSTWFRPACLIGRQCRVLAIHQAVCRSR